MEIKKAKLSVKVDPENQYIRVGIDHFKIIEKTDRFGIVRQELKKWSKDIMESDYFKGFANKIKKYDDFTLVPDNKNYQEVVFDCYNLYRKFSHKPKQGEWKWTKILLEHIFEDQYDLALKYLQILYLYPKQALPVLALVSRERQTGKSTFIDWISVVFGANFILINPKDITSEFNGIYATSNIIAIEETVVEKSSTVEKIKALSTQKTISTNIKMVQHFSIPFFGKIIIASNNEDKFIKIDDEEIRFWVRKVKIPTIENHNILNDMISEIPAFLFHLESLPVPDFTKSRMVFTTNEIENDTLKVIKRESRPTLYKELKEYFIDFFNNFCSTEFTLATPKEIKNRFFSHNNNYESSYIKEILIKHFEFEKYEKNISYKSLDDTIFKTGQPFIIKKSVIFDELDEKEGEKVAEKDLFFNENDPNFDILGLILAKKTELKQLEEKAVSLGFQLDNGNKQPF